MPSTTVVTSNTGNVIASSIVIVANWLIAHLATSWALPPEVQSAIQALLVVAVSEWVVKRKNAAMAAAATAQTVLAAPDPRVPAAQPAA